jgi:hypothetical protein
VDTLFLARRTLAVLYGSQPAREIVLAIPARKRKHNRIETFQSNGFWGVSARGRDIPDLESTEPCRETSATEHPMVLLE